MQKQAKPFMTVINLGGNTIAEHIHSERKPSHFARDPLKEQQHFQGVLRILMSSESWTGHSTHHCVHRKPGILHACGAYGVCTKLIMSRGWNNIVKKCCSAIAYRCDLWICTKECGSGGSGKVSNTSSWSQVVTHVKIWCKHRQQETLCSHLAPSQIV